MLLYLFHMNAKPEKDSSVSKEHWQPPRNIRKTSFKSGPEPMSLNDLWQREFASGNSEPI